MNLVEVPVVRQMSEIEKSEARMRVGQSSPARMIEWLEASGRTWLVLNSRHLVESFVWPEGGQQFQWLLAGYRDHRAGMKHHEETGCTAARVRTQDVGYSETLEVEELDRAIRFLIGEITRKDSTWKLENSPL